MGCDIRAYIEIKKDNVWHTYDRLYIDRNYKLFEKMAGVRGELENAYVKPRGLPDDMAFVTRLSYDHNEGDAHTPSWLTMGEVNALENWAFVSGFKWSSYIQPFGFIQSNGWNREAIEGFCDDVRLVFWFDS